MKYVVSLLFIGVFFLFPACGEDTIDYGYGEYYVELGTALGEEIFRLDNGKEIMNVNPLYTTSFVTGERIYMNFSYEEESRDKIKLRLASRMVQGILDKTNEEKILDHPNDPIRMESTWIGGGYLNTFFYIEHKSEPHGVTLWTDDRFLDKDTIDVYFLHTINTDERGVWSYMRVSFDLAPLLGEPLRNKNLRIHFNMTNYGNKFYEFNY